MSSLRLVEVAEGGRLLTQGDVIAFPTETFYGLAADPTQPCAIERLLELKDRALQTGVPLIVGSSCEIEKWVEDSSEELAEKRRELQQQFWPGPLTVVASANQSARNKIHPGVFGPDYTLALRVSSLKLARDLAVAAGGVITATSANPKAQPPAESAEQVFSYFSNLAVVMMDTSEAKMGISDQRVSTLPSTLIDVRRRPMRIIREGAVARAQLSKWL